MRDKASCERIFRLSLDTGRGIWRVKRCSFLVCGCKGTKFLQALQNFLQDNQHFNTFLDFKNYFNFAKIVVEGAYPPNSGANVHCTRAMPVEKVPARSTMSSSVMVWVPFDRCSKK